MIAFLKGVLAGRTQGSAVIEVNGIGFEVGMSQNSLGKLPAVGSPVSVHTYLQMRDDGVSLFGFSSLEEKALFERLITVSGIGPKVALAALSSFTPEGLATAIADQDVARVQKIPGVGKKTASRIILELKGSLDQGVEGLFPRSEREEAVEDANMSAAREALLSMGFSSAETELSLKGAPAGASDSALLQYALKRLGE